MRMLCIAAEADPIGYVTVNGRPLDGQDLARLTGVSVPEVETLLSELDRNGVFSRDRKGMSYSRRMVRDEKRRKLAQKNGKTGGNPTLSKHSVIPPPVNPQLNLVDNTHKPRSQIPEEKKGSEPNGSASPGEWSDDRTQLFGPARQWVQKATGKKEKGSRSLIGQWLKLSGDDAKAVLDLIRAARDRNLADPVAWIEAALHGKADGSYDPPPNWETRAKFYEKEHRWLDYWGDPRDIPPEYRDRFGEIVQTH